MGSGESKGESKNESKIDKLERLYDEYERLFEDPAVDTFDNKMIKKLREINLIIYNGQTKADEFMEKLTKRSNDNIDVNYELEERGHTDILFKSAAKDIIMKLRRNYTPLSQEENRYHGVPMRF